MPWLAVPYSDEARRSRLNRLYGIQGNSCNLLVNVPQMLKLRGGDFFFLSLLGLVMSRTETLAQWLTALCAGQWNSNTDCPAAWGMCAGYQVYCHIHCGSAARLALCLSLLSFPSSVCVQKTVDEVSKSWLMASPAKYVRNARRTSQHCPPPALRPLHFTITPTSVVHMRRQEHTDSCIICGPGRCLFLIRLLIGQGDHNQKHGESQWKGLNNPSWIEGTWGVKAETELERSRSQERAKN